MRYRLIRLIPPLFNSFNITKSMNGLKIIIAACVLLVISSCSWNNLLQIKCSGFWVFYHPSCIELVVMSILREFWGFEDHRISISGSAKLAMCSIQFCQPCLELKNCNYTRICVLRWYMTNFSNQIRHFCLFDKVGIKAMKKQLTFETINGMSNENIFVVHAHMHYTLNQIDYALAFTCLNGFER